MNARKRIDLTAITLARGDHDSRDDGVCLLEAVAWWAGEPHTDQPKCVSLILGKFGRPLNDVLGKERRRELVPFVPRMVGTAGDGLDETRGYMALDWLIRAYTPAWLDLAGLATAAAALRDLRRIVDLSAAQAAEPVVRAAVVKARAAWAAAGAAAWAAARDAAWDAARDAAEDGAGATAWDVAWDAAEDGAEAAGGETAWAAAAAAAAAVAVSGVALQPTVDQLQISAIALFDAMITPGS